MSELPMTGEPGNGVRVWHERAGDGVIVRAVGEIDLLTVPQLTEELAAAEKELPSTGPLVLDLTEVTFLASVGLSVLVGCHERCKQSGVELRIVTGNRTITRTIHITGLTDTLPIFATLADALVPTE